MDYIAHKRNETDGKEELLIDHLTQTAEMSKKFAEAFGFGDLAYYIGKLHDIGKYSDKFQRRIRNENIKVNHSTAGAITAGKSRNVISAFCISGHHGGLPDRGTPGDSAETGTLLGKLKDNSIEDYSYWINEQPNFNEYSVNENKHFAQKIAQYGNYGLAFLTHMVFSCLVDSDFLCTEKFMSDNSVVRDGYDEIPVLLDRLNKYIEKFGTPTTKLNILRTDIQKQCINAAKRAENLFSLTVPTGGGKTISSLAFALNYAVQNTHERKRVIYVIPYTSIIEQNAEVFEKILGSKNVIQHHSNVVYDSSENSETVNKKQLACENWDAPIIVTTAVQFFESLYSNKPAKSRKLHNLAESVIIFDEAQMLPVDYLKPCVRAINELTSKYNATAVLCTATQPNLDGFFGLYNKNVPDYKIPEICGMDKEKYVEEFRRAEFVYEGKLENDELVARLREENQVLCIVNTKKHAKVLFDMIGDYEGNICLSTHKYPKHRKREIAYIKDRLKKGLPCRVISTTLIEAGVDIDFKTVYRAISGIDSVLQAGGRCNRENKNPRNESIVHIFDTTEVIDFQQKNAVAARDVIRKYGNEIYKSDAIKMYFENLYDIYDISSTSDKRNPFDNKSIVEGYEKFEFNKVAKEFKLIDNNTRTVYIVTEENKNLIASLRNGEYCKDLFRQLEQYGVNLYEYEFKKLDDASAIEIIDGSFFVLADNKYYSQEKGIEFPDEQLGTGIFY